MDDWYDVCAWITGAIVFAGVWIASAITWGLWGFVFGWLPALILACICGFLWMLIVAALLLGGFVLILLSVNAK